MALSQSELNATVLSTLLAAVVLAVVVPLYSFFLLRWRLGAADAAAIAATYGSVSAVTFVTAAGYLDASSIPWSGHLVAAMALMESPAILVGIVLYQRYRADDNGGATARIGWSWLLRESCLNSSVFLILGSMAVGWISGPAGMAQVGSLVQDLFIGMLCLFLLDMGIVAARRLISSRTDTGAGRMGFLITFALIMPLANAALTVVVAWQLGLSEGDAVLLIVLAASASYIAVPAAMRLALPEADPGLYLPMSLAVTFPFNLIVGIPLYHQVTRYLLAS